MKTKLLLSTLTLGLLAGVYVWQAQAQVPVPKPSPGAPVKYIYKVVVQQLPAQPLVPFKEEQRLKSEALKPVELDVLKDYPDWEITHAELVAQYSAAYTPPHGASASWPAMVYTLRKAK